MSGALESPSEANAVGCHDDHKALALSIKCVCPNRDKRCDFYGCAVVIDKTRSSPIYKNRPLACLIWPDRVSDIITYSYPGFQKPGL